MIELAFIVYDLLMEMKIKSLLPHAEISNFSTSFWEKVSNIRS